MGTKADENQQIAARLREAAALLQQQGANPFRANAYRRAADTVARLDRPVRETFDAGGLAGLDALENVGPGIASAIAELLATDRWSQLDRLRGSADPEPLFCTVPGIGPALAHAIHETLHADTLEALETAAHDGRLERVPGVGARRAAAIRGALSGMLRRHVRPPADAPAGRVPPVAVLLEIDRLYRERAAAGTLPTIAPARFNPEGASWLPVLHAEQDGWHFTALFSNTARAHELGRTHDWVVIYFYDDHHVEGQHTVVTETRGPLAGRRVVRGREAECREHLAAQAGTGPA